MKVGIAFTGQNVHLDKSDGAALRGEIDLAVLAEELGFDFVNFPEHHFGGYSMSVDNTLMQMAVAARTSSIEVQLGVIVLPWNNPLRVAEKVLLLDALSNGRVQLGFGRGMSPKEYAGLGIPMEESRGRFAESAKMVLEALETGVMQGDGPFYPQPRVELRPRPEKSFSGRLTAVAMSPGSAVAAAELKARMMSFVTGPFEQHLEIFEIYLEKYRELHNEEPPAPVFNDKCVAHPDADVAEEKFLSNFAKAYSIERRHYELDSANLASGQVKGYESYAENAKALQGKSDEEAAAERARHLIFGTPEQILTKLEERRKMLGRDFNWLLTATVGDLSHEEAAESMRMISTHVLPTVRRWSKP